MLMHSTFAFEDEPGGKTKVTIRWQAYQAAPEEQRAFDGGHASMTQGWTGTLDQLDLPDQGVKAQVEAKSQGESLRRRESGMNTIASHAPASGETSSEGALDRACHERAGDRLPAVRCRYQAGAARRRHGNDGGALGYPPGLERGLGVLTLVCVLLYAVPRTAVLGAILLTGLFGGAMATHLRIGSPLFSHLLFGLYLGLLRYGAACYLRDARLRALIPLRV